MYNICYHMTPQCMDASQSQHKILPTAVQKLCRSTPNTEGTSNSSSETPTLSSQQDQGQHKLTITVTNLAIFKLKVAATLWCSYYLSCSGEWKNTSELHIYLTYSGTNLQKHERLWPHSHLWTTQAEFTLSTSSHFNSSLCSPSPVSAIGFFCV